MSIQESMEVECPQCGAKQVVTVWKSLDVKRDPIVKEALFRWEINVFTCDQCEFRAQLPVSLLYHDDDKQFCVQYHPVDMLGTMAFYQGFSKSGVPQISLPDAENTPGYMLKPHLVFDMAEMMRYIVFREIACDRGQ